MTLRNQSGVRINWNALFIFSIVLGVLYLYQQTEKPPADLPMPIAQVRFLEILAASAQRYNARQNDLQIAAIRQDRARNICSTVEGLKFNDWLGRIESISSTLSGKAALRVRITPEIELKTMNSDLSDIGQNTLIPADSPLYKSIYNLPSKQWIRVSGLFFASQSDCIREGSLTNEGSLTEPEFVVRFTNITNIKEGSR